MSDNRIERSICQAIEIMTNQKIAQANFDKTKRVIIKKVLDETNGKYLVKYQDSNFTAWSIGTGVKYKQGDEVLVLSPKGSTDAIQVIIGSTSPTARQYSLRKNNKIDYNMLGTNAITNSVEIELASYAANKVITLYNAEYQNNIINKKNGILNVNQESLKRYIKEGNSLLISYDIKTQLDAGQANGMYGIEIEYWSGRTISGETAATVNTYAVDSRLLDGSPYGYRDYTNILDALVDFQPENFLGIKSIKAFVYNFNKDEIKENNSDIFIKNLTIAGAKVFNLEGTDNYLLNIDYSTNGNKLDNEISQVKLIAKIKIDGKEMTSTEGVVYYWFKENASIISSTNIGFHHAAGAGWEAITGFYGTNKITPADTNQYILSSQADSDNYKKTGEDFELKARASLKKNKIKCIAYFDGMYISGQTIIYNDNINTDIKIVSSDKLANGENRTQYCLGVGSPTLTCQTQGISGTLMYTWLITPYRGVSKKAEVTGKKYSNFPIDSIVNYTKISCAVNKGQTYLGTASITLKNVNQLADSYELIIQNGNQVFQYDERGNSPCSPIFDTPLEVKPLSFVLTDPDGLVISYDKLINSGGQIYWYVPKEDSGTMLKADPSYSPLYSIDQEAAASFDVYKDKKQFVFSIASQYDANKLFNYIKLCIKYKDNLTLNAYTNFSFSKNGDPGTNGTDYMAKIVPQGSSTDRIYATNKNGTPKFFDDQGNSVSKLSNLLYKNSEILTPSSSVWKCPIKSQDTAWFSIDSDGILKIASNISKNAKPVNIVRAVKDIGGLNLYSQYPINFNYLENINSNYRFKIRPKTGFKYVKYSEDGVFPSYNNTSPFEVFVEKAEVVNGQTLYIQMGSGQYTCNWSVVGNLKSLSSNNTTNKAKVQPKDTFNGEDLTSAIKVVFKLTDENKTELGFLYIPIYMYINRYNHKALNEWDGNSIQIGEDDAVILAPQIGAGSKDDNNAFTGIFMGTVKDSSKEETGLFGYNSGQRSIFLDANTGKAQFGVNNSGRLIINPIDSTAKIQSNNYNYNPDSSDGAGMMIDFTTPKILFGSGKFEVDEEGKLVSTAGKIANWTISNNALTNGNVGMGTTSIPQNKFINGSTQTITARIWGIQNEEPNFVLSSNGWLYSKAGRIGGWTIGDNYLKNGKVSLNSSDNADYAIDTGNFKVTPTGNMKATNADLSGKITATSGKIGGININNNGISGTGFDLTGSGATIGGWTVNGNSLMSKTNAGYINLKSGGTISGGPSSANPTWSISANGDAIFKSGKIGGISITGTGLSGTGWEIRPGYAHFTGLVINSNGTIDSSSSGGISGGGGSIGPDNWTIPNNAIVATPNGTSSPSTKTLEDTIGTKINKQLNNGGVINTKIQLAKQASANDATSKANNAYANAVNYVKDFSNNDMPKGTTRVLVDVETDGTKYIFKYRDVNFLGSAGATNSKPINK